MNKNRDYRGWAAVLLILLAACIVRLHLLNLPLERDEGAFAYIAQLILKGIPPYRYAFDMRLPGIYLAYALIIKVFGQTDTGIHLGLLFLNAGTIVLLFLLGRRLFDSFTGAVAAGSFAVMTLSGSVLGFNALSEQFVVFFATAGLFLLVHTLEGGGFRRLALFASGLLLGSAFLMKQHGALFILFGGTYLTIKLFTDKRFGYRACAASAGAFFIGAALPYIAVCLWLLAAGVFGDFWFETVTYASTYVGLLPLDEAVQIFKLRATGILSASPTIWALTLAGLTAVLWDRRARKRALFLTLFFAFSFLAVMPGLYFRRHYFILFLPATALLAGVGASSLKDLFSGYNGSGAKTAAVVSLTALVLAYPVYRQRGLLFFTKPEVASRELYGLNPFIESREVAGYIKANSAQNDKIAVLGSEPQISFYSRRLSATRYIFTYPMMESHPLALGMQKEMIREIEDGKPLFIVVVRLPTSWLATAKSKRLIFDWSKEYTSRFYRPVGLVDVVSEDKTLYYWGDAAAGAAPESPYNIVVFRRRPGA